MGHEMSGTVIEKGPAVQDLDVGQEVCVNPSLDDRHFGADPCPSCQAGRINLCKRWCCYGLNANGGGFSEEIVVKSYNCLVLPEGVSPKAGQDALVLGAGPIGLAILLGLRAQGVNKVVVSEVAEQRALQAKKFGADMVVNPLKNAVTANDSKELDPVVVAIRQFSQEGVDVAFDATGLQSTLDTALAATKPGGTIFNVAIHEKPLMLNLNDIAILEKKLLGGICYTHEDWERVLDALKKGDLPFEQMITAIVPLKDVVHGGFQELIRNKAAHVKILIQPTAA
ncbi:hypothetical protein H2204_003978 [Knufia peltigerae]|uniref:Uncharacterized protein n=1 Tax=Knufia peltigerae TaxID=1002370 RepID=A0AA38Y8K3_9EURO|nr:hypothetical protein H2204_003978 [Knufia peltigerae]